MLTNDRMREVILQGIEKANRTHIEWTRNFWVSDYGDPPPLNWSILKFWKEDLIWR